MALNDDRRRTMTGRQGGREMIKISGAIVAAAATLLAVGGSSASAQDRFHWAGPYIGAHGGADFGSFDLMASVTSGVTRTNSTSASDTSMVGGVHGGYLFEFAGNNTIGIEGDWNWTDLSVDSGVGAGNAGGYTVGAGVGWDIEQYGTLRGRLGRTFGQAHIYVTGGVAYGDIDTNILGRLAFNRRGRDIVNNSDSKWRVGYSVGTGVELAVNDWLSLRTELLWTDFGEETLATFADNGASGYIKDSISFATIRAGLTVRLPTK